MNPLLLRSGSARNREPIVTPLERMKKLQMPFLGRSLGDPSVLAN